MYFVRCYVDGKLLFINTIMISYNTIQQQSDGNERIIFLYTFISRYFRRATCYESSWHCAIDNYDYLRKLHGQLRKIREGNDPSIN